MGKKALCLVFAFLLSINCFAAVVADNDGSAFITKAEFDSLKNNFQSQLDSYNTSIDNKIDNAIASYLAGINISKTEVKSIITSDWTDVVCSNKEIKNTLTYPIFAMNFMIGNAWKGTDNWGDCDWVYWASKIDETNLTNYYSTMNLIGGAKINNTTSGTLDYTNCYWLGQTKKYKEEFAISEIISSNDHWGTGFVKSQEGWLTNFEGRGIFVNRRVGYNQSYNNASNPLFKPYQINRDGTRAGAGGPAKSVFTNNSVTSTTESLSNNDDGRSENDYNYLHLIAYDKDQTYEVAQINMPNYLKVSNYQTLTSRDLTDKLNGYDDSFCVMGCISYSDNSASWVRNGMSFVFNDKSSDSTYYQQKLPTIGLLNNSLKAENIHTYKPNIYSGLYKENPENVMLHEGLPLLYAEKDTKIKWKPEFSLQIDAGASESPSEVYFALSKYPWYNKNMIYNDSIIKIKIDDIETEVGWTSNLKQTIEFTMPEDGFVYLKFWPAFSSDANIENNKWDATLKIENCNTYVDEKDK